MIVRIEYEGGRMTLCDAAVIDACYREHVEPPSKTAEVADKGPTARAGEGRGPGRAGRLARLLAEEKEEGTAKDYAGLFRLAVPRRVQVGDVVRGGQLPASLSLLICLIVNEPAIGSVCEQRPS